VGNVNFLRKNTSVLRFKPNPEKMVNAMAFLVSKCHACTKMKLFKLMYFADKEHLLKYGRPITGDHYVRMEWGPTPSASYDMTKGKGPSSRLVLFQSILSVHGNNIKNLKSPNMMVFSNSDEKMLNEIIEKYGHLSAAKLSDLSHKEATWTKTPENEIIDFELMFEGRDDAMHTLELLRQENLPASHASKTS
jgi:uncharacterized phage-associated protein